MATKSRKQQKELGLTDKLEVLKLINAKIPYTKIAATFGISTGSIT